MKLEALALLPLWRRVGRIEVWNWQFFLFMVGNIVFFSFVFDAVRLSNYTWLWIPVNILALALACAFVYLALTILKKFSDSGAPHQIFNLAVAGLAMGLKNAATLRLANRFGIDDVGTDVTRFLGGCSIGIILILIFTNLVGSQLETQSHLEDLISKERALLGFRENVNDLYKDEQRELTEKTSEALMPRFLEIQTQVKSGSESLNLTETLRTFLASEIRPLSKSIADEASKLSKVLEVQELKNIDLPELRIDLKNTILPLGTWFLTMFAWFMGSPIIFPTISIITLLLASLPFLALLYVLKALLHKVKPVSLNVAILFSAIPGVLCAIPSFWLLYQIPHTQNQASLLPSTYITAGWSAISISHAYLLSLSKTEVLNRLEEAVEKFARENKLFEQRLWVARHIWYTLLHGTVQSAVTAASIRSTATDQKSPTVRTLIVADLNRAMEALKNPVPERLQLEEQLEELKKTWAGIVEITVEIPEELAKEINNSRESVIIFNELLKEVLSNSVRHGQSTKVEITFAEPIPGEINVFVVNNGTKPKKSAAGSIGTSIFKSLCLSTELSYNKENKSTEFTALVPIATN